MIPKNIIENMKKYNINMDDELPSCNKCKSFSLREDGVGAYGSCSCSSNQVRLEFELYDDVAELSITRVIMGCMIECSFFIDDKFSTYIRSIYYPHESYSHNSILFSNIFNYDMSKNELETILTFM